MLIQFFKTYELEDFAAELVAAMIPFEFFPDGDKTMIRVKAKMKGRTLAKLMGMKIKILERGSKGENRK